MWGANKLTGKMVLISQREERISLFGHGTFQRSILDSFEFQEMVCLSKHGATFFSLNSSRGVLNAQVMMNMPAVR